MRLRDDEIVRSLALAESDDTRERRAAVLHLCTCHVRSEDERIWPVLVRLLEDADPRVRRSAVHTLTDSTPSTRVIEVVAALEARYDDPDVRVRKRIRRTLSHYRRTGILTDAPR